MICSYNPLEWWVLPRIGQSIMYSILLQSIIMFTEAILIFGEGQTRADEGRRGLRDSWKSGIRDNGERRDRSTAKLE